MARLINLAGQAIIKDSESLRLTGYLCPAGKPTIGWGHTGPDVGIGMTITRDRAVELFNDDLDWAEDAVSAACKVEPTENQFAAMVSLCFNIGAAGFKSSSVLRLHNAGKPDQAAQAFALWNKATVNGELVVMPGLVIRRAHEAALYMTPDSHISGTEMQANPGPLMPQAVEPPKSVVSSKTVAATAIGGAATVASVASQVNDAVTQVTPIVDTARTVVVAAHPYHDLIWRWGPIAFGVLGVAALVFVGLRYVIKARRGEIVST